MSLCLTLSFDKSQALDDYYHNPTRSVSAELKCCIWVSGASSCMVTKMKLWLFTAQWHADHSCSSFVFINSVERVGGKLLLATYIL